jgi:hypothetical protein
LPDKFSSRRPQARADNRIELPIGILPFFLAQAELNDFTTLAGEPPGCFIDIGLAAFGGQ